VHIDRVFTKFSADQSDPYGEVEFVERSSKITNADGSIVSQMDRVLVPTLWSQVAVDIMAQKYFRKAGVPARLKKKIEDGVPEWLCPSEEDTEALSGLPESKQMGGEMDSRQVFHRLAGCWTYWGWKNKSFENEDQARNYYQEMCFMLASQMAAPNSPQWFNTGLNWAYGIEGPAQGHYFFNDKTGQVEKSKNAYERPHRMPVSFFPSRMTWSGKVALWIFGNRRHGYLSSGQAAEATFLNCAARENPFLAAASHQDS